MDGICLGHLGGPTVESEDRSILDKGSKPTKTLTKLVCQEHKNRTGQSQRVICVALGIVRMEVVAYNSFKFVRHMGFFAFSTKPKPNL